MDDKNIVDWVYAIPDPRQYEKDEMTALTLRVGTQMKAVRQAEGLQIQQLAKLAHTGTAQIVGLEHGTHLPHFRVLCRIARVLGLRVQIDLV